MASSSSCALASLEPTSFFSCQTELEMESSKARHWSELDESATSSEWSAETNYRYFAELKNNPLWGRFFIDSKGLELGAKISEGAQADVYEARRTRDGAFDLVVKVMKGDTSLRAFQAQWPIGMLSARSKYKHLYDLPLITILGGTLLQDERLRGRFAFVMYRRWGDLRLLIDRRMKARRSKDGPFSIDQVIHLMLRIAEQMDILHTNHDILHRDLKASNVLVWGRFGDDVNFDGDEKLEAVVADFECSRLVMGTGFWKAPEIFQQLKDRVPSSEVKFSFKSDVYSYGMTSYEIVTGLTPFHPKHKHNICGRDEVLSGRRPNLPSGIPSFLRNIIGSCWHTNPEERPNFSEIFKLLKHKRSPNPAVVVIDNKIHETATIVKIEQWRDLESLTLFQVMERLVRMELWILQATTSFSGETVEYYLEVTHCEGGKVWDKNVIANVEKVKAKCWTRNGRLEWVMFVENKRTDWLLKFFCRKLASSRSITVDYSIALHKPTSRGANLHLQSFKPNDLKVLGNPSEFEAGPVEQAFRVPVIDFFGNFEYHILSRELYFEIIMGVWKFDLVFSNWGGSKEVDDKWKALLFKDLKETFSKVSDGPLTKIIIDCYVHFPHPSIVSIRIQPSKF